MFKFKVSDPTKTLTLSAKGSHHRPTLAVIPIPSSGTVLSSTSLNALAMNQVTRASPAVISGGPGPPP